MKARILKVAAFIADVPAKIARAKKAAVPVVTGVIGLLSIPTLGVEPEIIAAVVLAATTLGVYEAKNAPPVA